MAIRQFTPEEAKMNILIYGEPGCGKTQLAATTMDVEIMSPVLFLNIEGGLLTIAHRRPDVEDIESMEDMDRIFWALAEKQEPYAKYKTIVVDSGTELQTIDLEEVVAAAVKSPTSKRQDEFDIQIADYGRNTARMRKVFRGLRDIPYHVIMTGLPRIIRDKDGKEPIEVSPGFSEKLGASVRGFMDHVWYMYADDHGERHLLTRDLGAYRAKTRGMLFAEALGTKYTDPTMPRLWSIFKETTIEGRAVATQGVEPTDAPPVPEEKETTEEKPKKKGGNTKPSPIKPLAASKEDK